MSTFANAATPTCRQHIAMALTMLRARCAPTGEVTARQLPAMPVRCWHDTPTMLRELCAAVAGVGPEVVGKLDRDLSEEEKAALRIAIAKIKNRVQDLAAL